MNIQARKVSLKRIRIDENCGIHQLATKLDASLDAESIQKIVEFGMKSTCSGKQLAQAVKELEDRKKSSKMISAKSHYNALNLKASMWGCEHRLARSFATIWCRYSIYVHAHQTAYMKGWLEMSSYTSTSNFLSPSKAAGRQRKWKRPNRL
jgi:hypothetical protein